MFGLFDRKLMLSGDICNQREPMSRSYTTTLSAANFALNVGLDHGPEALTKLFPGMPLATARNVLDRGQKRLTFESPKTILVPDDLCEDDDGRTDDGDASRPRG